MTLRRIRRFGFARETRRGTTIRVHEGVVRGPSGIPIPHYVNYIVQRRSARYLWLQREGS